MNKFLIIAISLATFARIDSMENEHTALMQLRERCCNFYWRANSKQVTSEFVEEIQTASGQATALAEKLKYTNKGVLLSRCGLIGLADAHTQATAAKEAFQNCDQLEVDTRIAFLQFALGSTIGLLDAAEAIDAKTK